MVGRIFPFQVEVLLVQQIQKMVCTFITYDPRELQYQPSCANVQYLLQLKLRPIFCLQVIYQAITHLEHVSVTNMALVSS